MAPSSVEEAIIASKMPPPKTHPPARIFSPKEAKFEKTVAVQHDGREKALGRIDQNPVIVVDNGSFNVRAGWSFEDTPRLSIPPIMSRFRDRKAGKTYSFAGNDCYVDANSRSHIRNAFEQGSGVITNWDAMEHVLDYIFIKLGLNGVDGSVEWPIVMTEAVATFSYVRKTMSEVLFECYGVPSVAYGIDALFSYRYNKGNTGLVVSSSHTSTHVIPIYKQRPILAQATRLNWGGWHSAEYLLKLLKLKYPAFASKLNSSQAEHMLRDHCYLSPDYDNELRGYLDWTGLEDRDIVIQYPYTEEVGVQKSEEELARIAERKKESGRRLQEQAAKLRLEKLMRKEEELEYYKSLHTRIQKTTNKKDVRRMLDADELKDQAALEKTISALDKAVRKARTRDVGGDPEEGQQEPVFDLLVVPDDQLDEAGLKAKRQQRLLKSNHDARVRAKAEKEAEKARIEEEKRLDEERREKDLECWLEKKRQGRAEILQKMKERDRLKQDLGNRKSLASQSRMKTIANLASDNPTKKRRRGGDDDTFGADDDDWGVYRTIAVGDNSDDEHEEEDLMTSLKAYEKDLLLYDPHFTYEDTYEAELDWSKSILHAFTRGPRPFNATSAAEVNQIHLNVERIRVPEVVFQPSIAGVDQAGLVEMAGDILNQRLRGAVTGDRDAFLRDIFLTGGNTLFRNFDQRLRDGLAPLLPADATLNVRRAQNPQLDAWRGAAAWSGSSAWKAATVTRAEYLEKGHEYLKEHDLGNPASTV